MPSSLATLWNRCVVGLKRVQRSQVSERVAFSRGAHVWQRIQRRQFVERIQLAFEHGAFSAFGNNFGRCAVERP